MIYGSQECKGFALLVGAVGTDKTLLLWYLLAQCGTRLTTVSLAQALASFKEWAVFGQNDVVPPQPGHVLSIISSAHS
jgi:hypothetical protein